MSDEILENLVKYYQFGRTIKSKERVVEILAKNRSKLKDIFQGLKKEEIWKEIPNSSGYKVSSHGRFKNPKGKFLKQRISEDFYTRVRIGKEYLSHRLIASLFLEEDEKRPHVHHINAIPFDNRIVNLQYVTVQENSRASFEPGGGNEKRLRPVNEVDKDGNIIERYNSVTAVANATGLKRNQIRDICLGKWKTPRERLFVYADGRKNYSSNSNSKRQPIALYNTINNTIINGPFASFAEAIKIMKIPSSKIHNHINKGAKSRDNSQWRRYYKPDNAEEKWLSFKNTIYEVSNLGQVRNINTKNILKPKLGQGNRYYIQLHINKKITNFSVSRLVHEVHNSENFIPNYHVDHINNNKHDNRAINLQSLSPKENIQKSNIKSILQIDLEGNIVEEYKSIKDASDELKINPSNISRSAINKDRVAGGFLWRYSETFSEEEKKSLENISSIGNAKIINQYDSSENFIKRWIGMVEPAKFYNIQKSKFRRMFNAGKEIAGFIWRYAGANQN